MENFHNLFDDSDFMTINPYYNILDLGKGLHIVAARPGMGKTTLMLQSSLANDDDCYLYIEPESAGKLRRRFCQIFEFEPFPLNRIFVCDKDLTIEGLIEELKDVKGTVYIDYLQLLKSEKHFDSQSDKFEYIAQLLHDFSHDKCVIVFSQVNAEAEKRYRHRPIPEDIRFYEFIRDDVFADTVITIVREDYYAKPEEESFSSKTEFIFYNTGTPVPQKILSFDVNRIGAFEFY